MNKADDWDMLSNEVLSKKGEFTRRDFPGWKTERISRALNQMSRTGTIELVRAGTVGRFGKPAVYRVKEGV